MQRQLRGDGRIRRTKPLALTEGGVRLRNVVGGPTADRGGRLARRWKTACDCRSHARGLPPQRRLAGDLACDGTHPGESTVPIAHAATLTARSSLAERTSVF